MTATIIGAPHWGGLQRNNYGHRTFKMISKVRTDDPVNDGPLTILSAAGLPTIGSVYNYGNDYDQWAWCTPTATVRAESSVDDFEPINVWVVEQEFTTDRTDVKRCQTSTVDDPLNEPAIIRGGFNSYQEEAIYDKDGNFLLMSSYERMKGDQVLVEKGRPVVHITFNVGTLPLSTFSQFRGGVNDATLWGLPARTIRLADITWERLVYGICGFYYRISYQFEIKYETWNRFIWDQGTKVKADSTKPVSSSNPLIPYIDPVTHKPRVVYLDGDANPVGADYGNMGSAFIHEKAIEQEFNFLSLGIPTTL